MRLLKTILPKGLRARGRLGYYRFLDRVELGSFYLRRMARRFIRKLRPIFAQRSDERSGGLSFAMLCIRRPEYIDQAIFNINSLHYYNPTYPVRIYVDAPCQERFEGIRSRLDYPGMTETGDAGDDPGQPWQFTKVEIVLRSASEGLTFVDADERWHADPKMFIPPDKVCFLVVVNRFADIPREAAMLERLGEGKLGGSALHYNTGFAAIPPRFITDGLKAEVRALVRRIYAFPSMDDFSSEENSGVRRLCEEIGLSLGFQKIFGQDSIRTLKETDTLNDRHILQSFYYGCTNGVN